MFKPYSKNKSLGIPEGDTMTAKEFKELSKTKTGSTLHKSQYLFTNGYLKITQMREIKYSIHTEAQCH